MPFTVEFEVQRKNFGASNVATIRLYNLKEEDRSIIRKDFIDYNQYTHVTLNAGYGDNLSEIVNMDVTRAYSVRENNNFITHIDCHDGSYGMINGKANLTFAKATNLRQIILALGGSMESQGLGITVGAVSPAFESEVLTRGNTFSGPIFDLINEISGQGAFIDNSKLYVLKENEYLDQDIFVVNSQSGLLGTPLREKYFIRFEMLFEPKITPGCLVKLETLTGDRDMNNTLYVVQEVNHAGMISPAVSGSVITHVGCYPSPKLGVKPEVKR